jgi:hypothetical protein
MSGGFHAARQQVLRRVRYASNALTLRDNCVPPEGLYDAALTNGLLAIVAHDWPGEQIKNSKTGVTKPADALLDFLEAKSVAYHYIETNTLRGGLKVTQPARHGRADDEFAVLLSAHLDALDRLDEHPALSFLDTARGKTIDQCIWLAFLDLAEAEMPFDPKGRLDVPEPEQCDDCLRPTFLSTGWDAFGGTMTAGQCLACGYQRSEEDAWEQAVDEAVARAVERDE